MKPGILLIFSGLSGSGKSTLAALFALSLLVGGCRKAHEPATITGHLGTNSIGLVSIGVLNTVDTRRQAAIMQFFASNGIASYIEGTVTFDVLVRSNDVERVHTILKTNRPEEVAFHSAWESW